MRILFFDTETTGLPFREDPAYGQTHSSNGYPKAVQVGWLVTDIDGSGRMETLKERQGYLKASGFTMPQKATDINGITDRILQEKGEETQTLLSTFLEDALTCEALAGHNVQFDLTAPPPKERGIQEAAHRQSFQ